jgi:proteasome alpha subunit
MNRNVMMASRGYDMTPTMYSPDGRIYQVEYAIETVKRGAIAIGLQSKDGAIIAVEEKTRDLQVEDITQKIFQVDDHIGIAAAGYIPDARILVDNARFFSQSNKLTYDESVDIETVAKHLADQAHQFTQYSGVRPFGVALIIAGVDKKGARIFVTDPSGTYVPYAAVAIGGDSDEVTDFLEKNYKKEMSMDDAMSLAISAINLKSDENDVKDIRMSRIKTDTKLFEKVSNEELAKYALVKNQHEQENPDSSSK